MARLYLCFSLLLLTACGPSGPPEPFHGTWTVTSTLTPQVSAISQGAVVTLEPGRARVGDRTCRGASYTRRSLSAETFAEAYRVTPQQLSLTVEPIPLVDVTCEGDGLELGSTLVLVSDTKMLSMWEGVFYVLTRS